MLLADRGYDADRIRALVNQLGVLAIALGAGGAATEADRIKKCPLLGRRNGLAR